MRSEPTTRGTAPGSVGPQDAPPGEPWDTTRGLQDAPGGPQDATGPQDAAPAETSSAQVEESVESLETLIRENLELLAVRARAVGRRMQLVVRGRVDASTAPGGDLPRQGAVTVEWTVLDALPRPVSGPAFFGGREDAAYFRGWDDGVDGIRRGDQAIGPSWGSAAYMTGWKDAVRASERACRG